MKILTVVGARPNFMKAAPIIAAINAHNEQVVAKSTDSRAVQVGMIRHTLVHTGQHYDEAMSGAFFDDLNLPSPDIHLGVGSGSHAAQTSEIMRKFEEVLLAERPDVVVVVGDVNSTLACALDTAKISFDSEGSRPLIAHVEAGLRSFDNTMPEEVNRIVTDHVSDLLFVTEESGLENLRNEGLSADKVYFVGNTMIDSLLHSKEKAEASPVLERLGLTHRAGTNGGTSSVTSYALLTLHRPSNVDNPEVFESIIAGLKELGADGPVIFPVHPRTQRRIKEFGFEFGFVNNGSTPTANSARSGIIVTDPLGYLDFVCLMKHSKLVVTDSGGIQEETTILGIPCVTVRENTERPVTVKSGTNIIAGTKTENIKDAIRRQLGRKAENVVPKNWDGRAGGRILEILVRRHYDQSSPRSSSILNDVLLENRCACR